jgi:fatty-acyl-CoA synthase
MSDAQRVPENRLIRIRRLIITAALAFTILAPLLVVLGLVATRFGWVGWRLGLAPIQALLGRQSISSFLAMVGGVLGLIALLLAVLVPPRKGYVPALAAIALAAVTYAGFAQFWGRVRSNPPIHDVATDWREPILFSPQLMAQRGADANPVETAPSVPEGPRGSGFLGRPVPEVNAMTCPAATPLTLTVPPAQAYVKVKAEVSHEGLRIVTDDPARGVLEATATDFWGLKDDLAVRLRPAGAGTRVDMRSLSRHGLNDLGRNCQRITRLRKALT